MVSQLGRVFPDEGFITKKNEPIAIYTNVQSSFFFLQTESDNANDDLINYKWRILLTNSLKTSIFQFL